MLFSCEDNMYSHRHHHNIFSDGSITLPRITSCIFLVVWKPHIKCVYINQTQTTFVCGFKSDYDLIPWMCLSINRQIGCQVVHSWRTKATDIQHADPMCSNTARSKSDLCAKPEMYKSAVKTSLSWCSEIHAPILPIWNQWPRGARTRVSSSALSARRYHKPNQSAFREIICVSFQQAESADGRHIWSCSRGLFARRRKMEKRYQLNIACRTAVTARYGYCVGSTKTSFLFYCRALSVVSWMPRTYPYACGEIRGEGMGGTPQWTEETRTLRSGFRKTPPSSLDVRVPDGVFNAH